MPQNAYFLAKIGADTAENEQHFAENLPKIGNYPTGPLLLIRMCTAEEHDEMSDTMSDFSLRVDRLPHQLPEGNELMFILTSS